MYFDDGAFELVRCQHVGALLHESLSLRFVYRPADIDPDANNVESGIVFSSSYVELVDRFPRKGRP